eukprot:1137480-Prymnesium_polylepis.1
MHVAVSVARPVGHASGAPRAGRQEVDETIEQRHLRRHIGGLQLERDEVCQLAAIRIPHEPNRAPFRDCGAQLFAVSKGQTVRGAATLLGDLQRASQPKQRHIHEPAQLAERQHRPGDVMYANQRLAERCALMSE